MGFFMPCNSTRLICRRIFRRRAMLSDSQSPKLSAQSPPCNRKCSPRCAAASFARSASISQETTSGGRRLNCATARSSALASAYWGCWAAGRLCQLAGCQLVRRGADDMVKDASVAERSKSKCAPSINLWPDKGGIEHERHERCTEKAGAEGPERGHLVGLQGLERR